MRYLSISRDNPCLQQRANDLILRYSRPGLSGAAGSSEEGRVPVLLITGFGSFTQSTSGQPLVNITHALLDLLAREKGALPGVNIHIAVSPTDWLAPVRFHRLAAELAPDLILNLGQCGDAAGGPFIESGALNIAGSKRQEYDAAGTKCEDLGLEGNRLDDDDDAPSEIPLSMNPLLEKNADLAAHIRKTRPDNAYICNATAYILAASLAGRQISYLDGAFVLEPLLPGTSHGFIHMSRFQGPGTAADPDNFNAEVLSLKRHRAFVENIVSKVFESPRASLRHRTR